MEPAAPLRDMGPPAAADPTETPADLRRARHAAEAANEAKTRYLVAVSHEIRSPLNAIYGYAQLLERDDGVSPAEAGAVIRRSAEHLANLVEGVLEISRIESGVMTVRSDTTDVRALLADVVEMFRMQAAAKGLALSLDLSPHLPRHVRTDEKRFRQILINLLSNAVKYTVAGGIAVTVGYRTNVADIEVRDTGTGIAPQDLERVFQPFERGHGAEARREPGLGLGLAITRLLAQVMGGDISVTSMPGVGSRFRLRMMLAPSTAAPRTGTGYRRVTGYQGPRRTLLAVDDDPAQLAVLGALLRPLGFTVRTEGTGATGIAAAEATGFDLALLDIQMPGLGGWEVAARLRRLKPGSRIVMLSADVGEAAGPQAATCDGFLAKPVNFDALLDLIGEQLDLGWTEAEQAPDGPTGASLAPEAAPFLQQARQAALIGHLRGMEDALAGLERTVPTAAPLAAALRAQAADLDLDAFVRTLTEAEGAG
jgi:CheY-like chemotaxis protein